MSRLNWETNRDYDLGVDRGVFYPKIGTPEVWNGLISVVEDTPSISERTHHYEGRKLSNRRRDDSFSAKVSAYSYPPSFLLNLRVPFGMSYRVETARGYRIHLVYNAKAHISGRAYGQLDTVEPFSFSITTVPIGLPEVAASAHLIVDTAVAYSQALAQFESILYGDDDFNPRLPQPDEVFDIFETNALYKVIDNGDGTFTLEAPDDVIEMLSETLFEADWPKAVYLDEDTYRIRSW